MWRGVKKKLPLNSLQQKKKKKKKQHGDDSENRFSHDTAQLRYEPRQEKNLSSGFSTRVNSNRSAQLMKLSRVLKCQLYQAEILYYPGSEQQRR